MSTNGTKPTSYRKNHGRGHSYWIDGEKVPSITGALGKGYPKAALVNWAADESAKHVLNHWDELVAMQPGDRYKAVLGARFTTQKEAAVRGTAVHEYAQRLAAGEEVTPPVELMGHVDAYLAFAEEWQPRELLVEEPVYSRTLGYAGTPGLVAELADGKTWLLDWKTAAKGVYLDNVLQLAAARFAEYTMADGVEVPLPKIDRAGIVWLRADGYDLVPVEANEHAFFVFRCVKWIADYVDDDRENWIADALRPPEAVHA